MKFGSLTSGLSCPWNSPKQPTDLSLDALKSTPSLVINCVESVFPGGFYHQGRVLHGAAFDRILTPEEITRIYAGEDPATIPGYLDLDLSQPDP